MSRGEVSVVVSVFCTWGYSTSRNLRFLLVSPFFGEISGDGVDGTTVFVCVDKDEVRMREGYTPRIQVGWVFWMWMSTRRYWANMEVVWGSGHREVLLLLSVRFCQRRAWAPPRTLPVWRKMS